MARQKISCTADEAGNVAATVSPQAAANLVFTGDAIEFDEADAQEVKDALSKTSAQVKPTSK